MKGDRVSDDCRWFLRGLGFKFLYSEDKELGNSGAVYDVGMGALGSRVSATRKKGSRACLGTRTLKRQTKTHPPNKPKLPEPPNPKSINPHMGVSEK